MWFSFQNILLNILLSQVFPFVEVLIYIECHNFHLSNIKKNNWKKNGIVVLLLFCVPLMSFSCTSLSTALGAFDICIVRPFDLSSFFFYLSLCCQLVFGYWVSMSLWYRLHFIILINENDLFFFLIWVCECVKL